MKKKLILSISLFLCFSGSLQAWSVPGFDKLPWGIQWTTKLVVGAVCFIPKHAMDQFREVRQLQDMIKEVDQQRSKLEDLDGNIKRSADEQKEFQAQTAKTIDAHNGRIENVSGDLEEAKAAAQKKIEANEREVTDQLKEVQRKNKEALDKLKKDMDGFGQTQEDQFKELRGKIEDSNNDKARQLKEVQEAFSGDFGRLRANLKLLQAKASSCESDQQELIRKFGQVEMVFGKLKNRQERHQSQNLPGLTVAGSLLRKTMDPPHSISISQAVRPIRIEDVD